MNENLLRRCGRDVIAICLRGRVILSVFGLAIVLGMLSQATPVGAESPAPPRAAPDGDVSASRPRALSGSPEADWGQVAVAGRYVYWLAKAPGDSSLLYAAVNGVGVYTSNNGGQSWTPMPIAGLSNVTLQTVTVCPSGTVFAGTWGGGVFRWDAPEWVEVNNGLGQLYISSLACNPSGTLLAGTYDRGVYRSTNSGGNWAAVNNGLNDLSVLVLRVSNDGTIMAGTRNGAFQSTSGGASWSAAGLNGVVYDFAFDPNDNQRIWAATGAGVFQSSDRAASWAHLGSLSSVVYTVTLDGNGELYAGAPTIGVFRWSGGQWNSAALSGSVYCLRNTGVGLGRLVAGTANGIWMRATEPFTPTPTMTPTITATPTATATPTPGLTLRLINTPQGPVSAGDAISYTVRYELVGGSVLNNVVITNAVPPKTELIAGSIQPGSPVGSFAGGVVTWELGDVGPGEASVALSYAVRVVTPLPTTTPTASVTPMTTPTATDVATPTPTATATETLTPTLTPETPPAPSNALLTPARPQVNPSAPLQENVVVINEGAWAAWDFGGARHETRSNMTIQGPLNYLPMIFHHAWSGLP